jgi:uncharacterized protein YcnI
MKLRLMMFVVGVALLLLPAFATAHVTLQPNEVPAGGFTRLDVRVPNEEDNAATTKVEVQMPDGFAFVSYEPVPGWTIDVKKEKLPEPIEGGHGSITEQVKTITFTADNAAAGIQPGQFLDFGLSAGIPDSGKEGDILTFPAIQTYDNGTVVRWIEAPDAEKPAPVVTLTEPDDDHGAAADVEEQADDGDSDEDGDGASKGLAIAALALGAIGTALGLSGLFRRKS